jgi:hypothetical protein
MQTESGQGHTLGSVKKWNFPFLLKAKPSDPLATTLTKGDPL